jgi:ribose 5-phosphate isomerase
VVCATLDYVLEGQLLGVGGGSTALLSIEELG